MPVTSITRPCYALESLDGKNAELTLYGEIVNQRPINYYTGEPLDGDYIIQNEFLKDLETVADAKTLTIRINSLGGDASVAILIHNRLRELARAGVELICIVDGVAASGGSLIMCASDTVKANPSSLVMIHNSLSFLLGWYNVDALRQKANQIEKWDDAQRAIYTRKTGLSDAVLRQMMQESAYFTGEEAVEKGFADELLEDAEPLAIAASADRRNLFVRGRKLYVAGCTPDYLPILERPINQAVKERNTMPQDDKNKQQELQATASDATAVNVAVQAERKRLQEIDALASLYDVETVQAAKYGDTACTAQEMTYRAAQAAAKQGKTFLDAMEKDVEESGAQQIRAAAPPPADSQTKTPAQRKAAGQTAIRAMLGGKQS